MGKCEIRKANHGRRYSEQQGQKIWEKCDGSIKI